MTKRQAKKITAVLTSLLMALAIFVYQQMPQHGVLSEQTVRPGYYRVTEVFDGDTFAVDMNNRTEKIRLIGVDTPETHKPGAPVQCFGPEASDFTKKLLTGNQVRLEADPTGSNRDRYDRLLRYAFTPDGTLLNQHLITEGYGFAYLSFQFQKQAEFAASQASAQDTKKGLWAACTTKNNNGRWSTNDL